MQLDYEESVRRQQQEGPEQEDEDKPGKLRLASKIDLNRWVRPMHNSGSNAILSCIILVGFSCHYLQTLGDKLVSSCSMDVDLTAQLLARKKSVSEATSSSSTAQGKRSVRQASRPASNPPTRLEQKAWARGGKFSKKVCAL